MTACCIVVPIYLNFLPKLWYPAVWWLLYTHTMTLGCVVVPVELNFPLRLTLCYVVVTVYLNFPFILWHQAMWWFLYSWTVHSYYNTVLHGGSHRVEQSTHTITQCCMVVPVELNIQPRLWHSPMWWFLYIWAFQSLNLLKWFLHHWKEENLLHPCLQHDIFANLFFLKKNVKIWCKKIFDVL